MALSAKEKTERRARRIAEKGEVTSKISDTTRFVAFGLLIAFYSIHAADAEGFASQLKAQWFLLLGMGLAAALAILCDYLQYFFGLRSVDQALERETLDYDDESFPYRARKAMFVAKQWLVIAGAGLLVVMVMLTVCATKGSIAPSL